MAMGGMVKRIQKRRKRNKWHNKLYGRMFKRFVLPIYACGVFAFLGFLFPFSGSSECLFISAILLSFSMGIYFTLMWLDDKEKREAKKEE